jgi:hypothetical protein
VTAALVAAAVHGHTLVTGAAVSRRRYADSIFRCCHCVSQPAFPPSATIS